MAFSRGALALCVVAILIASAHATCPDYKFNSSCNTGSCSAGGLTGNFEIPETPNLHCGGSCLYSGLLPIDSEISSTDRIKVVVKKNPDKCCQKCKKDNKCQSWQFVDVPDKKVGLCFLYLGPTGPVCNSKFCPSSVGGKCKPTINDDPHLVGAQGAHFDFSGAPDKSFCLITDRHIHVNMKMTGYLDERTQSATVIQEGKALRTWIRELGIIWTAEGVEHKLRLAAREGKEIVRGEGFLAVAELDASPLPRLQVGDELALEGGLVIKLEAIEKKGIYDVDFYTVRIGELLDMDVRLRVANPLLQRPEDAEAHISLGINNVKTSEAIHGVLGQTYRAGREQRAVEFNKLVSLLHRHVGADTAEGKGLLDGETSDYVSSDVLAADCTFTAYSSRTTVVDSE